MKPKMLASEAADILGITVQAIHKQLKTKKYPHFKLRHRVYFEYETAVQLFKPYKTSCKVVVFVLVKGGVGKTTTCREAAIRATLMGKRVLVIEIDHQGNLTKSLGIKADNIPVLIDLINDDSLSIYDSITPVFAGLDIIPSRYDNSVLDNMIMLKKLPFDRVLKNRLNPLRDEYDLIFIDCPPSLGQAVTAASLCADLIVLPTTPCDFSDSGLDITIKEMEKMQKDYEKNIPIKIILNQYDTREGDSFETLSDLIQHNVYGKMLFNCYIRKCKEFTNVRRKQSTIFDTTASTFAREDMDKFTRELLDMGNLKGQAKAGISEPLLAAS